MSATSVSMVATSAASSSSLCNKVSYLCFSNSSMRISSQLPSKPKIFIPPNLKIYVKNFATSSSLLQFRISSAAFDDFDVSGDYAGIEQADSDVEPVRSREIDNGIEEEKSGEGEERKRSWASEAGRLYVGNLPYSMNSSQLAEVFSEAGTVDSVEVIYDRVTDRSRGFAFVTMATVQEAKDAIRMFTGSQVGGRTIKVNFPEVPKGGEREVMGPQISSSYKRFVDSPHKIYAGNLSWTLNSQRLTDVFAHQPGMLSAKVIYDRSSGKSRGFGFVSFDTPEEAERALNSMNGVEVDGRPLRLNSAGEQSLASSPRGIDGSEDSSVEDSDYFRASEPKALGLN